MSEFHRFFLEPGDDGARWVKEAVRRRFGFSDDRVCETVLSAISDRRRPLLAGFYQKYQKSLYRPVQLDAKRLAGYFVQVARVETRRLRLDGLLFKPLLPEILEKLPDRRPQGERDPEGPRAVAALAQQLKGFWSTANGFLEAQRSEGLVSLGLGFCTDDPEIARRCRGFLQARLPAWEARQTRLRSRIQRELARWEELREDLCGCDGALERAEVEKKLLRLEEGFRRLNERLVEHRLRLFPKPRDVKELLGGGVNVGNVRFRRIAREIDILQQRVHEGRRRLARRGGQHPAWLDDLCGHISQHLDQWPKASGGRGVTQNVRDARRQALADWKWRGLELLATIRSRLRQAQSVAGEEVALDDASVLWLADAEDLYALGVLERRGVQGALGFYSGWRLDHLLRTGDDGSELT